MALCISKGIVMIILFGHTKVIELLFVFLVDVHVVLLQIAESANCYYWYILEFG